jgi:hypothetical protein
MQDLISALKVSVGQRTRTRVLPMFCQSTTTFMCIFSSHTPFVTKFGESFMCQKVNESGH